MTNQERIRVYGADALNERYPKTGRTRPMQFDANRLGFKAPSFRVDRRPPAEILPIAQQAGARARLRSILLRTA